MNDERATRSSATRSKSPASARRGRKTLRKPRVEEPVIETSEAEVPVESAPQAPPTASSSPKEAATPASSRPPREGRGGRRGRGQRERETSQNKDADPSAETSAVKAAPAAKAEAPKAKTEAPAAKASAPKAEEKVAPSVDEAAESSDVSVEEQAERLRARLLQEARPYAEWEILSPEVKRALADLSYKMPTPVQRASVEPAMSAQDMVVQAKTGTGKTSAFGIPIVELVEPKKSKNPQALILVPTRELAGQVADEISALGRYKGVRVGALYGGIKLDEQIEVLAKGVDIVVGTPGRLADHLRRQTLSVDEVRVAVLDEADEMLSMGFYLEVAAILEKCPEDKQMLLFSATLPPDIEGLVRTHLQRPLRLMVSGGDRRVEGIHHVLYFSDSALPRPRNLLYIIEKEGPGSAIIFCNTREETSMVASYLLQQGKQAEAIHGDIPQKDREDALQKLKDGELQFLVATDVAARGIDISGLSHVINYNFPMSLDIYLHRAGRTGRQGRKGTAISMVDGNNLFHVSQLKRIHKIFFDVRELPKAEEIVQLAASRHLETLFRASLGHLIEPYLPLADAVALDGRGRFIMAYLLKLYHEEKIQPVQEALKHSTNGHSQTSAAPVPSASVAVEKPSAPAKPAEPEAKASAPATPAAPAAPVAAEPAEDSAADNSQDAAAPAPPREGPVRLYLSIGSSQGYNADALRQMVINEAQVSSRHLGAVQMERHYAFLDIESDAAEKVLAIFQGRQVGDFTVNAEVARRQPRRR
ncbi:MAG: DEAD/DEAH box helicase [Myxococcales bacterium]|nr:DEAD/DEAH box helicase [Myxococcales bacterium]